MKKTISGLLAFSFFLVSCSSTTLIQSGPDNAKLYLNGEPVGVTPYTHTDTRIVGSSTTVRLEKEGYETLNTSFSRDEEVDVGAIVGGIFVMVPFLWTMKYKPVHTYELVPLSDTQSSENQDQQINTYSTKADQLRELKLLMDEGLINQDEYDNERRKILNGSGN